MGTGGRLSSGGVVGTDGGVPMGGNSDPGAMTSDGVEFMGGRGVGRMTGYGWVDLGAADMLSSPVCAEDPTNTAVVRQITGTGTQPGPCPSTGAIVWSNPDQGLCLSGTLPVITGSEYTLNWGIMVGVNASEPTGGTLGKAYSTIRFDFNSSAVIPINTAIRGEIHIKDDPNLQGGNDFFYCATIQPGKAVSLAAFSTECWAGGIGKILPMDRIADIDKIAIQISSDTVNAYAIGNFCWSGIFFDGASPSGSGGAGGAVAPATGGAGGSVPPDQGTVKVSPAILDFGTLDVGESSTPQIVTVAVSGAPVAINAAVTGAGFGITSYTCASPQPIGACSIGVVFAPTAVGLAGGVLSVNSATVALSGKGGQPPTFTVAPDRIDLGTLKLNGTASVVLQIAPIGTLAGLTCVSGNSELAANPAETTCPAAGNVVAPCAYGFTFTAVSAGSHSDVIVCNGGGKTTATTVVATVNPPTSPASLAIAPATQSFQATIGKTDIATFNLANSGGSNTGPLAVSITAGATDFSIVSNDCVVPLAPLSVCHVQVQYAPKTVGTVAGTLTASDATTGVSVVATLAGTAVDVVNPVMIPSGPVDFGTVAIGASSPPTTFTMTNSDNAATGVLSLAGSTSEFPISNDLCTGVVLPARSGQCTFMVSFVPAARVGLTSALITVSDTGGLLASVKLTGAAVQTSQ